jgi:hypothetical protein
LKHIHVLCFSKMLYLCICIHRIPIHISIFIPDLLADGLNPNAHNTIGSLEPPLGPRAAILRRRSRGALGCEARESQSAHGRGVGASQSWEGVEEARDLEALQHGRRRRRSPSGQRVAAGDDYACGRHSPPWGGHFAHLPLHVVSSENLVRVSWTDDGGAWALQSPWRRHLLDHRRLFLVGFLFCTLLLLLVHEGRHRWCGAALGRWL